MKKFQLGFFSQKIAWFLKILHSKLLHTTALDSTVSEDAGISAGFFNNLWVLGTE
jgi:hypothetical protein